MHDHLPPLILAGGEGTRIQSLTQRIAGDRRPKQFCRLLGGATLFEQTLQRAGRLIPSSRTMAVLVRTHEAFYAPLVSELGDPACVVQPVNRGTAAAILYGLLRLRARSAAPVAIFPSDHYVSDDERFMAFVAAALDAIARRPDLVVLLGVAPDSADDEYGWIEPGEPITAVHGWPLHHVRRFWEKPSADIASMLRARGCVWNSFVIVAFPGALISLIERTVPGLPRAFLPLGNRLHTRWEEMVAESVYATLPATDFSRQVLSAWPAELAVLTLDGLRWSDLGLPRRLLTTVAQAGLQPTWLGRAAIPA